MEIIITVKDAIDDMAKDLTTQAIERHFQADGFKVHGVSRLIPGEVTLTLLDEATWNIRQATIHESCRNSLGQLVALKLPEPDPARLIVSQLAFKYRSRISHETGIYNARENPSDHPDYGHLHWMLEKIQQDPSMSLTKRHRWLGYVQGVLIERGLCRMQEERDETRSHLNGA